MNPWKVALSVIALRSINAIFVLAARVGWTVIGILFLCVGAVIALNILMAGFVLAKSIQWSHGS